MQLSNSFSLSDLTFSQTAVRKGIPNVPNDEQIANLTELAQALERIQSLLGSELHIDSGFRSPKLNAAIGGSVNSAHMEGYAADFICPTFGPPFEVCKAIRDSEIPFDQLIQEGSWVHLSVDPRMRREVLTAFFASGKATYTNGLVDG
jgi:hypothetical protein